MEEERENRPLKVVCCMARDEPGEPEMKDRTDSEVYLITYLIPWLA